MTAPPAISMFKVISRIQCRHHVTRLYTPCDASRHPDFRKDSFLFI